MTVKCGPGVPARYVAHIGSRRCVAIAEIASLIAGVWSVVSATLREIFDESAYQRFLERNGIRSSPAAYAIFQCENDQAKARRPRCC